MVDVSIYNKVCLGVDAAVAWVLMLRTPYYNKAHRTLT